MRRFGAIVAVVVIASALAACSNRALAPGEARLTVSSGRAEVATTGGGWHTGHNGQRLHRGERVRVLQGTSQVQFSNSQVLELRRDSEVQVLPQPVLVKGDVLATAKATQMTVSAGAADAQVRNGAAHIVRSLGVTGASYAGDLAISSAGRQLTVPALRQATIPGPGLVPASPAPLDYRADNPWDRRYLGDAIDLGDELEARSRGFTSQLAPDEGHTAGFYRQLIPSLDSQSAFGQGLLDPDLSPGDTLVGAAITVEGHTADFSNRWRSVFTFRNQGARWGLVALDQHVSRAPLLSEVDDALGRRTVGTTVAAGAAPAAPTPLPLASPPPGAEVAPASGGAGPTTGPTAPPAGSGGGKATTTTAPAGLLQPLLPGPSSPPSPTPTTTAPPGPVGGLIQGVGNVVGGLLGGLLSGGR